MTANELIARLREMVKEHGNLKIAVGTAAHQADTVFTEEFLGFGQFIVIE